MDSTFKHAYLSPATGSLDITVVRDARPYATISLDLGIPNFTVFSLKFPLVEDKPNAMAELIGEAVHVLLDEMSAFMISLGFDEKIIVNVYATVLTCFKGMSGEADTSKSQSAISKDPIVKTFEGTFKLPMEFVNETYEKVVTASSGKAIKRPPVHRHLELTYEKPSKTTVQDARTVIKQFRNRSLKSQPSPMYVIVYDSFGKARGTIPIGPQFKNQLLNVVYKKGSAKVEFTPTIKFDNDIEMKTTNAEGIPKGILVGDEQYTPVATISDDMALYSSEQDEYIVKFTDGRCVAFTNLPTVESLKDDNYPVPTVYTEWVMLPENEVPESSDENEAVDERGTEVIEGTESESNPIVDLKPDDEKNEQLEEGVDEKADGAEKTSSYADDYRGVKKRPNGMSSQSWKAIQQQLKEEEKKFDPDQYIDPLTNVFGKLAPDLRKRLAEVLKNPNQKTWSNAYSIILNGDSVITLWRAVLKVDPWFPRTGPSGADDDRLWEKIPSRETLIAALRYANPAKQDTTKTPYDEDFMKSLGITGSRKRADHFDESGYWVGSSGGASGVLPICTTTGRICLAWRSAYVDPPNCWGTIGGAIQRGKSPEASAKAELKEEVGYHGSIRMIPAFVFTHGSFKYHNFLGLVSTEFGLNPMQGSSANLSYSDETDAIAWFTWEDLQEDLKVNASDYHAGVISLLQQSGDQIREICQAASNKGSKG